MSYNTDNMVRVDKDTYQGHFLKSNEYYDFIEFLQNELGFDRVEELQQKFGGSFVREEDVTP